MGEGRGSSGNQRGRGIGVCYVSLLAWVGFAAGLLWPGLLTAVMSPTPGDRSFSEGCSKINPISKRLD